MSVWCVKISHFIKTWIKPRTLLQNRWWGSGLLALKQLQSVKHTSKCEGMWVCWPSVHAHNLLWESLLWEMGWDVLSWLSNEVFPMPVLCSSSAMENVMIRSRIKKKLKKNPTLLLLFFQCKIKLPVIIYSNPDNWRLRLALRTKTRIFNSFQALFPWPHLNDLFNQKPLQYTSMFDWYTSMQRGNLEEQKLKGCIIPSALLLGSHCSLEHHTYKRSFHFPNTPDCSWKSAQSLAQKQIKTKLLMNYRVERFTAKIKALFTYNVTSDCHHYTRTPND